MSDNYDDLPLPVLPRVKLTFERVLAPSSGKPIATLLAIDDQRRICPYFVPNSKQARRAEGLHTILKDVELVSKYYLLLSTPKTGKFGEDELRLALWQGAIVTYARCFADAAEGRPRLSRDDFETEELRHAHDRIVEIRNTYVAHAGVPSHLTPSGHGRTQHEIVGLHVALNPDLSKPEIVDFYYDSIFAIGPSQSQLADLAALLGAVGISVARKLRKVEASLLRELEANFKIDELYAEAVKPIDSEAKLPIAS